MKHLRDKPMSKHLIILAAILLVPVLVAQVSEDGFVLFTPDELEWTLRENGTSLLLLEGDPQSEGFYIQRLKFPPGSVTTPHYHDRDRYVTVISGTWYAGIGENVDRENAAALGPGSGAAAPLRPAGIRGRRAPGIGASGTVGTR